MKSFRRLKQEAHNLLGRALSSESLKGADADQENREAGADEWVPNKTLIKPPNQLQLSEKELEEEFTRILNANNPRAPQNIARFNLKDGAYKCMPNANHLLSHFETDSLIMYKGEGASPLGGRIGSQNMLAASQGDLNKSHSALNTGDGPALAGSSNVLAGDATLDEQGNPTTNAARADDKPSALKNQFTLCERAAQTLNHPSWDRSTNTEPPPRRTFTDTVNQWTVYDAYLEDLQLKEKAAKERTGGRAGGPPGKGHKEDDRLLSTSAMLSDLHTEDVYYKSQELRKAIQIIERMANQNTFDEITQDYKYWEDKADELRESKHGVLLPLWKFASEKEKKRSVTALTWSSRSFDLFAVGYGNYDFSKQGPGAIACFTLKNPSYPEILLPTTSGVLSLDFHAQQPHLLAVGLYDGNVAVYNLQKKTAAPVFQSDINTKHADPVWQVKWQKDDLDENPNLCSVSSDGHVAQWTLLKNELVRADLIQLNMTATSTRAAKRGSLPGSPTGEGASGSSRGSSPVLSPASVVSGSSIGSPGAMPAGPLTEPASPASTAVQPGDLSQLFALEGGTCFDFHKTVDHLFVVGTEEGQIHQCSKTYSSQYLTTYEGHNMGVYALRYNAHYPSVFLSASADWLVKLWDQSQSKPLMTFDLASPVGDVAWAPYSSTVFAAVTAESKVYVFDLDVNRYNPICVQQVVRKGKLTHVRFNPFEPVLIVGDDRGTVTTLKLSPNLRKTANASRGEDEHGKMERILMVLSGRAVQ